MTLALFPSQPLLMIGCGNMGRALVEGWIASGALDAAHLVIVDRHPDRLEALTSANPIRIVTSLDELDSTILPAAICLAVKPKALEATFPDIVARFTEAAPLIFSVAAGKSLSFYEQHLWSGCAVVRTMPNTPVSVREGINGCIANAHVTQEQRAFIDVLCSAVGETVWLNNEDQMHAFTGLAGSGPAYIFYLMECFIQTAREHGFSDEQARTLTNQLFLGSAKMAQSSVQDVSQLRTNVTSPQGTTQAGLSILMQPEIAQIIAQTVAKAAQRSHEMAE